MFPQPQKFFVGAKVISIDSGWTGVVVRKTKNKSSPWVVKWDKNGRESNVNSMSTRVIADVEQICRLPKEG